MSPEYLMTGLSHLLTLSGMACLAGGVLVGILVGATPGLSPAMGVALVVPFSYGMDPVLAFIFFVAIYQAANYGGSITAIAINAPGTPSAVVTAIDGYALTKRGRGRDALAIAVQSSALGGFIGAIILILLASPIAAVGLTFGPAEYFALAVFGLATVVGFATKEKLKTTIGISLGLLLSFVGIDSFSAEERFTFGALDLFDGFSFIPLMIGLFALSEIFTQIEQGVRPVSLAEALLSKQAKSGGYIRRLKGTILRSSGIGTAIGVIPGAGATIAAFISYASARRRSTEPEEFGHGAEEGIAASEAANSSSVGGALIPLLALGVPGSATDAVLLGALSLHGLVAGPQLFQDQPALVYGIFLSVLFANLIILLFGSLGNRVWLQVIRVPQHYLFPLVISMCVLGSYTLKSSLFDAWVCLAAGLLGWLLRRFGYPPAPIILGLVLGEMFEVNLRRTLVAGGWEMFLSRPIALSLLVLAVCSLFVKPPQKQQQS